MPNLPRVSAQVAAPRTWGTRQPSRYAEGAPRLEFWVAVALVIGSSSALFPLLYGPVSPNDDAVPWLRDLWLPVYGLTVLLAVYNWRMLGAAWAAFLPTLTLLILTAASISWSIAPDISLRRWEALAFNALLALYIAVRFTWPQLVRIIAVSLVILAFGSLAMCLGLPSIAIHTDVNAGAWRGLWIEKNELGFMMLMGALASLACALTTPRERARWLIAAAFCAAMLLLARSGTSLICLLAGGSLTCALALSRGRPAAAVVATFLAGCVGLALAIVLATDVGLILQTLGKDPTLTGRTDVWAAVVHRIAERPALGYGYEAFWHDRAGPALLVRRETGWPVPDAHNGWLELALQTGWLGVAVTAPYAVLTLVAAARRLFQRDDGFWSVAYVAAFLISSVSESQILRQNSLEWILLMATSIKLTLDLMERRTRPPRFAAPRLA